MCSDLQPDARLSLLSAHSIRPWASLSERRRCIVCDRVFTASEVRFKRTRTGVIALRCPTRRCLGTPSQWVHPEDPLISAEAWEDWDRIIEAGYASETSDSAEVVLA